ncbi:hypothetical protein J1N35_041498 [Gossypium stocksii]|uniref:Uncharacterized protein n=1 Tax=Gossypium stocksii TaxID=47602 RepID=A0A9D3UFZ3_9ROSI|nr:hypothetical protein J1N35_041498 [Gossypium stocksii]
MPMYRHAAVIAFNGHYLCLTIGINLNESLISSSIFVYGFGALIIGILMQDMIKNVLEIKDTHVREVMTPLIDVVAIDASSNLVKFHNLWLTHQYSRVPAFEQRIDNIIGIAYAMYLLDYVPKGELLENTTVGDMAHKLAYFVPGNSVGINL